MEHTKAKEASSQVAVLVKAHKSQSYNYREARETAAKILIKAVLGERANGTVDETPLSDDAVGHRAALGTDRAEAESALHTPGPRCACASKTARVRGTNKPLAHAGAPREGKMLPGWSVCHSKVGHEAFLYRLFTW